MSASRRGGVTEALAAIGRRYAVDRFLDHLGRSRVVSSVELESIREGETDDAKLRTLGEIFTSASDSRLREFIREVTEYQESGSAEILSPLSQCEYSSALPETLEQELSGLCIRGRPQNTPSLDDTTPQPPDLERDFSSLVSQHGPPPPTSTSTPSRSHSSTPSHSHSHSHSSDSQTSQRDHDASPGDHTPPRSVESDRHSFCDSGRYSFSEDIPSSNVHINCSVVHVHYHPPRHSLGTLYPPGIDIQHSHSQSEIMGGDQLEYGVQLHAEMGHSSSQPELQAPAFTVGPSNRFRQSEAGGRQDRVMARGTPIRRWYTFSNGDTRNYEQHRFLSEEERLQFARSARKFDLLRELRPDMMQYLNIQTLLPYLVQSNMVTPEEEGQLLSVSKTDAEKRRYLLNIVPTKGPEAFDLLLEALTREQSHKGHKHLAEILTVAKNNLEKLPLARSKSNGDRPRRSPSDTHVHPAALAARARFMGRPSDVQLVERDSEDCASPSSEESSLPRQGGKKAKVRRDSGKPRSKAVSKKSVYV